MGFQVFQGILSEWTRRFFLALNGDYIVPFSSLRELRRELEDVSSWNALVERAVAFELAGKPQDLSALLEWRLAMSLLDPQIETNERLQDVAIQKQPAATHQIDQPRLYFRYSPFPKDRRVRKDGGFTAGTYATTLNDASMVPSGFAAVGRYALPSTLSAQFLYPLLTAASPVYVGTATPNFGQAGGGVEVLFPTGADPAPGAAHRIARE